MADALTQTVGGVYFLKNGTYRDPFNLSSFSPASNVNRIEVYLEDGVSTNVVMINYKADNKGYPSSVFFPMIFDSTNQHTVAGEAGPRTFAKYWALVPPQVLQWNANGNAPMSIAGTVVQIAGSGLIGAYKNYSALVLANPATEALYEDGEVAYVWELEDENNYGFYMVAFDSGTSTYSWERIETPVNQIENVDSRQYNIVGMQIQKGNLPRPTSVVSITEQYIRYIMTYIAQANGIAVENRDFITILNTFMSDVIAGTQPLKMLTFDDGDGGTFTIDPQSVAPQLHDILLRDASGNYVNSQKLVEDKEELDLEISNFKDGTTIVGKATADKNGNDIVDTYETKTDATTHKARTTALETFRDVTVPATYETKDGVDTKISTHDTSGTAHADIRALISALQGSYVFRGFITVYVGDEPTSIELTARIDELLSRTPITGDVLIDNSEIEWYFDGTTWNNMGQAIIALASAVNDGLMSKEDFAKLLALPTNATLTTLLGTKVDKDFTSYAELTTDLSDDDYIVVRDISNNQTKKTKVSTLRQFETDTYEYGVRYIEGQESSTLERVKIVNGEMTVGSATGLVANVGVDDEVVVNSFDNIDIFVRNRVVIGGNTFVRVNKYYIREYSANEGGTIYVYTLMCAKKLTGYRLPIRFDNGDGTEKDYAYLSAYEGYVDENGVARSISGVLPTTSISRGNSRIASRKNDGDGTNTDSLYGIKDQAEYNDLVAIPIYIEFANKDSQVGIGRGVVDLTFDANTVADSTVANTAIIANNANFEVDMTIYLSTGTYHTITQIDVDTPIAGQTTITFDGATVTPLTGVNLDPRQYKTGLTDSVVASTGFYKANDGKHPFKWRGMENVWGNVWKFVDGVKISNWYAWVSTNPAHYDDVASDVNGDYGSNWTKLSYQNALANGYIKEMGYDDRFPFARLPIEVGGGSSTYYADYYYQNSGDRTLLVGGFWPDASSVGLTFWNAINALGLTYYNVGFRLSYRP